MGSQGAPGGGAFHSIIIFPSVKFGVSRRENMVVPYSDRRPLLNERH